MRCLDRKRLNNAFFVCREDDLHTQGRFVVSCLTAKSYHLLFRRKTSKQQIYVWQYVVMAVGTVFCVVRKTS